MIHISAKVGKLHKCIPYLMTSYTCHVILDKRGIGISAVVITIT